MRASLGTHKSGTLIWVRKGCQICLYYSGSYPMVFQHSAPSPVPPPSLPLVICFSVRAIGVRSLPLGPSPLLVLLLALSSLLVRWHEAHQSASQVSQLYLHTPPCMRRPHSRYRVTRQTRQPVCVLDHTWMHIHIHERGIAWPAAVVAKPCM